MTLEPIVNELEEEFQGELKVLRVNIQEQAGREFARQFGFEFTPTFLLLDGQGEVLIRSVGMVDPDSIRAALDLP